MRFAPVAAFVALCSFPLVAQSQPATDPVHDFVSAYILRNKIPGLALMVRKNGKVIRAEGYGFSNLELKVPVKPETVFQSGSLGKQFTAMGLLTLVDEKKLALDDPVSKYLDVPATWHAITIRHLLTHTSGLGDYPADFNMRKDYTEDEEFKMITAQSLHFAPGEKWEYSNLGYVTLGILIHKISGTFYGDLLAERIFKPLGMTSTRIISEEDIIPDRAAGYRLKSGVVKNQEWVSPMLNTTADGSLYFNILDLAKWDEGLERKAIIRPALYDQMWAPVRLNNGTTAPYGFGWDIEKAANGHRLIEHGGAWQGFRSHISRYPDDRLTVVVLCNLAECDAGYITHQVARLYDLALVAPSPTAIFLDSSAVENYAGNYQLGDDKISFQPSGAGHLRLSYGDVSHEIIPESPTEFFQPDSDDVFQFVVENGKVTGVKLDSDVYKKVQ